MTPIWIIQQMLCFLFSKGTERKGEVLSNHLKAARVSETTPDQMGAAYQENVHVSAPRQPLQVHGHKSKYRNTGQWQQAYDLHIIYVSITSLTYQTSRKTVLSQRKTQTSTKWCYKAWWSVGIFSSSFVVRVQHGIKVIIFFEIPTWRQLLPLHHVLTWQVPCEHLWNLSP